MIDAFTNVAGCKREGRRALHQRSRRSAFCLKGVALRGAAERSRAKYRGCCAHLSKLTAVALG
eukprot:12172895-Alexandrium_andersonii.AAC.1